MTTKHPLWKAINAQLKVVGATTKLRALDEFRAKAKLKDDWCTLHASYQPREGRIAGHLRFELVAEGPEAMTVVANFLRDEERLLKKVKQKLVFEHVLDPELPPECSEATLKIEAQIISWHSNELIDRLAPWAAEAISALLWIHDEIRLPKGK
jgi:hypothetical protein